MGHNGEQRQWQRGAVMANDNPTHKLKVGDLAKIAGVSPSTVSKVINGRPGI